MATPDTIRDRLKSLIPSNWFSNGSAALRDAVFGGLSDAIAWVSGFVDYARAQSRIATATGYWLDLISWDFFGAALLRRPNETDDHYRPRILAELLRPRATRAAITQAVTDLTGFEPSIIEPWNPNDCGAYDIGNFAYAGDDGPAPQLAGYDSGLAAYDVGPAAYLDFAPYNPPSPGAGVWGDPELNNQVFINVRRGAVTFDDVEGAGAYDVGTLAYGGGVAETSGLAGYDANAGGWDAGALYYESPEQPNAGFRGFGAYGPDPDFNSTDEEIFATVAATVASGVVPWTRFNNA